MNACIPGNAGGCEGVFYESTALKELCVRSGGATDFEARQRRFGCNTYTRKQKRKSMISKTRVRNNASRRIASVLIPMANAGFRFSFSEVLRKGEKSDSGDRTISIGLPKILSGLGGEDF